MNKMGDESKIKKNISFINKKAKKYFEKTYYNVKWIYLKDEDSIIIEIYDKEVMYENPELKKELKKNGFKKSCRDYIADYTKEKEEFAKKFCKKVNENF